jgi:hypothetical protein
MCEECVKVIRKHFSGATDDGNFDLGFAAENEVAQMLWCETAFPIGGPEQLDAQIQDWKNKMNSDIAVEETP